MFSQKVPAEGQMEYDSICVEKKGDDLLIMMQRYEVKTNKSPWMWQWRE